MKIIHIKLLVILTMLGLTLSAVGQDCMMHIRTINGESVDVKVSESAVGSTYGNLPAYPASIFYVSTGQITTAEDGRPVPVMADGVAQGAILCEVLLSDITEINFTGLSGIKEVTGEDLGVTVMDGVMRISRVAEPVHVTVAAISGLIEYSDTITSDTEIDLNRYGKGVHSVSVGTVTFKILIQ